MIIFHQNFFYLYHDLAVVALSHTDPQDLSQCSRLALLQVTDSNLPHTGFWDDPLCLTIVPKIIWSCCSWESREASSSWSPRFMNRSRCFPQCSRLNLWHLCQCGVRPSRAELSWAEPGRAWSHKPEQQHRDFHCEPIRIVLTFVKMSVFYWDNWEDEGERMCHTPEKSRRPLTAQRQWASDMSNTE